MWWCGDFLICFGGGFFGVGMGILSVSGHFFGVCGGGGDEWLRFVGLFLWTGWIFVGLFRGGIWAGLMKS